MNRSLAFAFIWGVTAIGVAFALTLCGGIGWCLGSVFHAPVSGALCGVSYYLFGWAFTCNDIADRNAERIQRLARSV